MKREAYRYFRQLSLALRIHKVHALPLELSIAVFERASNCLISAKYHLSQNRYLLELDWKPNQVHLRKALFVVVLSSPSVGVSCKVGFVYLFRLAFCASSVARAEVGLPEIKQPQDDLWTNCNLDHTFTPFTEQFIGFGDPFHRERVGD